MAVLRLLERMTVKDVQEALTHTRAVLVPIGCVEQHGYHLPLATDVLTATATVQEAARRTGACVAPPVWYSFSGGSLPGTVNVSPEVTSLYLQEIGAGLVESGFRQLVFVTGHCGSEHLAAVKGACEALTRRFPEVAIAAVPLFEATATWVEAVKEGDFHSGWVETSLIDHIAPEQVRPEIVQDEPELLERMRRDPDAYKERRRMTRSRFEVSHDRQDPHIVVGVMGHPEKHAAEKGQQILAEAVETVVGILEEMAAGDRRSGGLPGAF